MKWMEGRANAVTVNLICVPTRPPYNQHPCPAWMKSWRRKRSAVGHELKGIDEGTSVWRDGNGGSVCFARMSRGRRRRAGGCHWKKRNRGAKRKAARDPSLRSFELYRDRVSASRLRRLLL